MSLAIEVLSYASIPFAPNALWFTAATMVGAFGTGFGPAIQSVALGLYTLRGGTESGKLFGAMSVVQSLWCVPPARARSVGARLTAWAARRSSVPACTASRT